MGAASAPQGGPFGLTPGWRCGPLPQLPRAARGWQPPGCWRRPQNDGRPARLDWTPSRVHPAEGGQHAFPRHPTSPGASSKGRLAALAGNRTRVNCLEGSYAHHYTTNAARPRQPLQPGPADEKGTVGARVSRPGPAATHMARPRSTPGGSARLRRPSLRTWQGALFHAHSGPGAPSVATKLRARRKAGGLGEGRGWWGTRDREVGAPGTKGHPAASGTAGPPRGEQATHR